MAATLVSMYFFEISSVVTKLTTCRFVESGESTQMSMSPDRESMYIAVIVRNHDSSDMSYRRVVAT